MEVATIVRWILRVLLVMFLAWLFRAKQQQEEEEEEEQMEEDSAAQYGYCGKGRGRGVDRSYAAEKNAYRRSRQPVSSANRRPERQEFDRPRNPETTNSNEEKVSSFNFDSIIDKLAKPKERPTLKLKAPGSKSKKGNNDDVVLNMHSRPITHISFSNDGDLLFTCSKDKLIIAWTVPDGEVLGQFNGHRGAVWACSVTKHANWLVSCGADRLVIMWDVRSTKKLTEVELAGVAKCVEWAKIGNGSEAKVERFAACSHKFGSNPAELSIWAFDGTEAKKELTIEPPVLPSGASQVSWGRDDAQLVTCHEEGDVLFWCAKEGVLLERLKAHEGAVSQAAFTADRTLMATCGHMDMQLRLWDIAESAPKEAEDSSTDHQNRLLRKHTHDHALKCVALRSTLSREQALGDSSKELAPCECICGGGQDAREVALVGNSSDQFETLLFRISSAQPECFAPYTPEEKVRGHFGPIHTLAFAPDGTTFASGSEDGCVRLHRLVQPGAGREALSEASAATPEAQ